MAKIETFARNCTLVAVKSVLNGTRTDEEILGAFRAEGYVDNQGMANHKWIAAAVRLGLVVEQVKIKRSYGNHKYVTVESWRCWDGEYERLVRSDKYTLKKFITDHPEGTFFVSTDSHAFVVVDGCVHDPNCLHSGLAREVQTAHRVVNSPLRTVKGGKIRTMVVPSRMSASRDRRMSAHLYILNNGPTTGEELVANTEYTAADLAWDEKRGNLKYV